MRSNVARRRVDPVVVTLVLVAFALTGLGAGITAGAVLGGSHSYLAGGAGAATKAGATTASSPSPSPIPSVMPYAGSFTVDATVTPNPVVTGQHLIVSVSAVGQDGSTPAPGVRCTLEDTSGASLLPAVVAPQTTDVAGHAAWDVVAPASAAGRHTLKVLGSGAHYHYYVYVTVTVTG